MCILFLHVDPNPTEGQYRLIGATNRDENYRRPALPAFMHDETNVIGGVDMEPGREGGMWLGFTSKEQENGNDRKHCFSALLNLTGETSKDVCGRGSIVSDYLESYEEFPEYVKRLEDKRFNGFNLVGVELSKKDVKTYHHSNNPKIDCVYSGKQTLGFGNNTPYNPSLKVMNGRTGFIEIIEKKLDKDSLEKELISLLKDTRRTLSPTSSERLPWKIRKLMLHRKLRCQLGSISPIVQIVLLIFIISLLFVPYILCIKLE